MLGRCEHSGAGGDFSESPARRAYSWRRVFVGQTSGKAARSPSSTPSVRPPSRRHPNGSSAPGSPNRTTCWRSAWCRSPSPNGSAANRSRCGRGRSPKLGAAQPVVLSLDRRHPGRSDRGTQTRSHRRHQRRRRRRHLHRSSRRSRRPSRSPARTPFFEPWKDQAAAIGQAAFQDDKMKSLITAVDDKFTARGHEQPAVQRQEGPCCCRAPPAGRTA